MMVVIVIIGVLLALLVVAPFQPDQEMSFVLAKDEVNLARERMRLTEALYRGEDSRGRPFVLRGGSAVQKTSAEPVIRLSDLSARCSWPAARQAWSHRKVIIIWKLKSADGRTDVLHRWRRVQPDSEQCRVRDEDKTD
ncbi:MAG: hypothetical protein HC938_16890 [Nitrospira sp.]|nr:hypothetical protein [Nitrospira sp.]